MIILNFIGYDFWFKIKKTLIDIIYKKIIKIFVCFCFFFVFNFSEDFGMTNKQKRVIVNTPLNMICCSVRVTIRLH